MSGREQEHVSNTTRLAVRMLEALGVTALALTVSNGCGGARQEEPARAQLPPSTATAKRPAPYDQAERRRRLLAQAEEALARSRPLDYRRPFSGHDDDERKATAKLFLAACLEGDTPSCWIAHELDWTAGAKTLIVSNCIEGDLLSCRALEPGDMQEEEVFPDAPGSVGRSQRCQENPDLLVAEGRAPCDLQALARECEMGFPYSCRRHELRSPSTLAAASNQRVAELMRSGCQARISQECEPRRTLTDEERGLAERMCPLVQSWCIVLAQLEQAAGDTTRARDLQEQACQHGDARFECFDLGQLYLKGELPEPEPGRGKALVDWACAQRSMMEFQPCKARARITNEPQL